MDKKKERFNNNNSARSIDKDAINFINFNFDANNMNMKDTAKNIEGKIFVSQILSESRKKAKPKKCFYCKAKIKGVCNSHSVPASCLRNIAFNGNVYHFNMFTNIPLFDIQDGVSSAGTFHLLCNKCDNTIFREYENPTNYVISPTQIMLSQIAMKNHLKNIAKQRIEEFIFRKIEELHHDSSSKRMNHFDFADKFKGNKLDLEEYNKDFQRARAIYKKDTPRSFEIIYFNKLDYIVPFAFQNELTILFDFNGNILNDVYRTHLSKKLKGVHVCVLPFYDFTVVLMFVATNTKKYNSFHKQFLGFSPDVQLAIINYMIFLYSDAFHFSPKLPQKILTDENLKRTIAQTTLVSFNKQIKTPVIFEAKPYYNLKNWDTIPNLLDEKYKILK